MTREQWLNSMVRRLRPAFRRTGNPLPEKIRVSCGFPSRGALGKVIGQCWSDTASSDGTYEIFVSPRLSDPQEVGPVLVHELVHAAVGIEAKHGPMFVAAFRKIGMVGKATQCAAGPELLSLLASLSTKIGPYPHAVLEPTHSSGPKAQKGRMIKVACAECGFQVYMTRKWLDEVGTPHCPDHGPMDEA